MNQRFQYRKTRAYAVANGFYGKSRESFGARRMNNKIVYIEWMDSLATSGWQSPNYRIEKKEEISCISVGFVHDETDYSITITTSISNSGCPMDPLTIPKCAILNMDDVEFK